MDEGGGELLGDKTRPSRIPPLPAAIVERVVGLTPTEAPAHAVVLSVDEKNQVQARRRQALMKPRRHRARLVTRPAEAHRPRSYRHSHGGVNSPRHIPLRVFLANSSSST